MRWPKWMLSLHGMFALVVLSFVAATGVNQWQMHGIDRAAMEIAHSTTPSIEHLGVARNELRNMQHLLLLRDQPNEAAALLDSRQVVTEELDRYLELPLSPAEAGPQQELLRALGALDTAARRLNMGHGRLDEAARAELSRLAGEVVTSIIKVTDVETSHAHDLAVEIGRLRVRAAYTALGLDVLCTLIAIAGALTLRRRLRAHSDLVERHHSLLAERASELEQFGGRVAHDILSPLGTVQFALQLAAKEPDLQKRVDVVGRGAAALERVNRLVHGLLGFARAGARPEGGATASVSETLADLAVELQPAAEAAGARLVIGGVCPSAVACDSGVLTSLIGNLARNAIKYIGDGPERRIHISCHERGGFVRVEVRDTGPGLPPDLEQRVFEPYMRGRSTQPGIGLGLATVKRLAEAHGGRVGVRSVLGTGCTFWFELPIASDEDVAAVAARTGAESIPQAAEST